MATRTSQPAGGALLISELKEFASFPKATQRYIRRSLDVAYGRSDPLERGMGRQALGLLLREVAQELRRALGDVLADLDVFRLVHALA